MHPFKVSGRPEVLALGSILLVAAPLMSETPDSWIERMDRIIEATQPLEDPATGDAPFHTWAAHVPEGVPDDALERVAVLLHARGIPLIVNWHPDRFEQSMRTAKQVARLQRRIGSPGCINATACLHSFFNGDPSTAHVDAQGQRFFDESFGPQHKIGCPFTLDARLPEIRTQVTQFVDAYAEGGLPIDMIFADWEIDGPLEFNRAHAAAKRCVRCREAISDLEDFKVFQAVLRRMRARLQKKAFTEPVLAAYPEALVGNYAVYPHDGYRYWYDYFEFYVEGQPHITEQRACYRAWYPEFPETGYSMAMPVVYPWENIFGWTDIEPADARWLHHMLKVADNAGRHTPPEIPLVSFVHYHVLPEKDRLRPETKRLSDRAYRELLWHMLLRGTDRFFVWSPDSQAVEETRLAHEVYRESRRYAKLLERGRPLDFAGTGKPGVLVSAVMDERDILAFVSRWGEADDPVTLWAEGRTYHLAADSGKPQLLPRSP